MEGGTDVHKEGTVISGHPVGPMDLTNPFLAGHGRLKYIPRGYYEEKKDVISTKDAVGKDGVHLVNDDLKRMIDSVNDADKILDYRRRKYGKAKSTDFTSTGVKPTIVQLPKDYAKFPGPSVNATSTRGSGGQGRKGKEHEIPKEKHDGDLCTAASGDKEKGKESESPKQKSGDEIEVMMIASEKLKGLLRDINNNLIEEGGLVGTKPIKDLLVNRLLMDESPMPSTVKTIGVSGPTGSGKTTLVRKVYEDERLRERFGIFAWVTIPRIHDESLLALHIFQQLALQIGVPITNVSNAMETEKLVHQVRGLIQQNDFLMVVDDLCTSSATRVLQRAILESSRKSRLIVTTSCVGARGEVIKDEAELYELTKLDEKESWALFQSKTFDRGECPPHLIDHFQQVVGSCDGLPEAIVLLSELLRRRKERSAHTWESIVFEVALDYCSRIQQVLSFLAQEFDFKSMLLYLSIFPDNSLIDRQRITRLWFAESFLYSSGTSGLFSSSEQKANDFIQKLQDEKMIELVDTTSDGRLCTFQLNRQVREIIVLLSEHRNMVSIISKEEDTWQETARHLSIQGAAKEVKHEKHSQISSILVFHHSHEEGKTSTFDPLPSETFDKLLWSFDLLSVLDLTSAPLDIVPDALFTLILLKYLSLRHTSVKAIPPSIGNLAHLEFLDLKHSLVVELPVEVVNLKRARHILVYHLEKDPIMLSSNLRGFKAAFTIGEFKYLEKLCFVKSNIHLLKELWKLKELRRLGITKLRTKEGKLLCSSLDELKNLQSLNLHAVDEDEIVDLNHLSSPPKFLKHLYLHGRLEKLPDWIPELKDLTKVILRWSQLGDDRLVMSLGGLPNLVELELRRAYIGDELHFKDGQFPKLKILLLDELEGLRSMTLKEGAMPDLNMLTISRCPWLKSVPTGIEHLKSVQKLIFFDMPDQLKERLWADDEEGGYEKRDYMPEVYFGQYRVGHWEYCYID